MKSFKKLISKLISIAAAAAMLVALPGLPSLKADAAEPTTYYLKYDLDKGQWRMQINEWLDDYEGQDLYYLNNGNDAVKDGDIVVVLSNEKNEVGHSDISINARLSNLTVNRASVVLATGGVDNCYVLSESYAAITGNVTNAYVYDEARCTFHSNVTNLHVIAYEKNTPRAEISVGGTVAYAAEENSGGVLKEFYNFVANTFYYDRVSGVTTDESNYSKSGNAPAAASAASTGAASTSNASTASTAASGGYDDVPKTGESNVAVWLFGLSALSFAGCLLSGKKVLQEK